jgi:hypothetical protein
MFESGRDNKLEITQVRGGPGGTIFRSGNFDGTSESVNDSSNRIIRPMNTLKSVKCSMLLTPL